MSFLVPVWLAANRLGRPDTSLSPGALSNDGLNDYLKAANKKPGEFLFAGRPGPQKGITTRQYARLVSDWIGSVGLDPRLYGTHSLRRTKATLIYRRTGNLRAVRLLLGTATYCPRTTG
jgi:integrase